MHDRPFEPQAYERAHELAEMMREEFGDFPTRRLLERWEGRCEERGWQSPITLDSLRDPHPR
jgi:hypothetical protein